MTVEISKETQAKLDALNEDIASKMKAMQEQMVKEGGELLKQATAEIFAAYPDLYGFSWEQYTPYFNDGDTCEFGVRADYCLGVYSTPFTKETGPSEDDDGAYKYEYEFGSSWGLKQYEKYAEQQEDYPPKWKFEVGPVISKLVYAIPEDTLKMLFGDHAEVYVTRDEVWTEECNHE